MDPHSMQNKQFNVRIKGYDQDQVDNFLDVIESCWKADLKELERLRGATAPLPVIRGDGPNGQGVLSVEQIAKLMDTAKLTADAEVADAKQVAQEIRGRAETEASAITASARDDAKRIVDAATEEKHKEIGRLEEQRVQLQHKVDELKAAHNEIKRIMSEALERANQ